MGILGFIKSHAVASSAVAAAVVAAGVATGVAVGNSTWSRGAGTVMTVYLPGDIPMEMVWCPAGSFTMGSARESEYTHVSRITEAVRSMFKKDSILDEKPHKVKLTKGFWIGRTEVTQPQWEAFAGYNNSFNRSIRFVVPHVSLSSIFVGLCYVDRTGGEANLGSPGGIYLPANEGAPVENVSWHQCVNYATWLNAIIETSPELAGGRWEFSLPTEAQWEYACRAGSTTEYPWGDSYETNRLACVNPGKDWPVALMPSLSSKVASFKPNGWGIYDMNGNVAEWTLDYYDPDFYANSPEEDPKNDVAGTGVRCERVIRGGGHWNHPDACRSACRDSRIPSDHERNLGFRVVLRERK